MIFNGDNFLKTEAGHYVAEASELRVRVPLRNFTISNFPTTGQHRTFEFVNDEMFGDHVCGWWFEESDGPNKEGHRVLIFND